MALGRKNKKNTQKLWRPDFREVQTLPDTKVIRTGFLLNFMAIAVTVAVVVVFAFREYELQSSSQAVSALEAEVADNSSANRGILESNKRFKQSSALMEEVVAFDRKIVDYPALVKQVALAVPEGLVFNQLEISASDEAAGKDKVAPLLLEISGRITAAGSRTPSQILTDFQEKLTAMDCVAGRELGMELTRFNRNNEFGFFDFTLHVLIPPQTGSES
jgi:hypothetical protein